MKNLPYFLITFFMISLGSSLMGQKFGRYQVAVIPGGNNNVYSGMVQKALGEDKRFLFISDKDIPIIMKEWEKRQSGITENDSVSMLKNVDYFVEVANVQISGPIRIENKDSKGNITVTYQTGISIDIKVTDIQGGGEIKMRSASGQGNDSNIGLSQQEAQRGLQSSIAVSVEILFPIVAELYDVNSSHAKILSGSQQGVKSGQKYIVKNKKTIHIRDKERTLVNDVGLIQINKVNDDNSEAFVILGDMNENNDLGSMWAEEKHYSNIAWELGALGSMNLRSLQNGQFFGGKIGVYSGNLFQFGLAADIFTMGSYFGVTPSLELRYNIHLFKGLFLLAGINGGLELMSATTNLRVPSATPGPYTGTRDGSGNIEVPSQKITVPSLQLSVTALAGFKLFFGPNVYSVLTVGYIYSQDANWNYIVDKNTPAELRQSIANYNPYIANAARNGAKLDISLGYLF